MRIALTVLLMTLPVTSFGAGLEDDQHDALFECSAKTGPQYSNATIKIYGGSRDGTRSAGHFTADDMKGDIDVYNGVDNITVLYMGDGFALNYAIHLTDMSYDFTASGSKFGFAKGTCTMTQTKG